MRILVFLMFFSSSVFAENIEAKDACDGFKHQKLLADQSKSILGYSFTIDKDPPYQFAVSTYAHEKGKLSSGILLHLEHRGCNSFERGTLKENHYHFHFTIPGKHPDRTDVVYWTKKTTELLSSLGICRNRKEFTYNWCDHINEGMKKPRSYQVNPQSPHLEGLTFDHDIGSGGESNSLKIKVKNEADKVQLEVGNMAIYNNC